MSINENQMVRYTVNCAGNEVSQANPLGLEYICVEDHVDMIGQCELTFAVDRGTDWGSLEEGADIEVALGGDTRKVFVGKIAGLRHSYQKGRNTVQVSAMDPMVTLAASRKVVTFEEMTDSDVASKVISDAGLTPGTVDATTRVYPYTIQRNESDFNFLRRLASRNGYILMANEGKIDFKKPQYSGGSTSIGKDKVISMDYSMSPKDIPQEITTYGWDYVKKEPIIGTASAGDITTIGGGANIVSASNTYQGSSQISDVWVDSQDSAKEMAAAELNRMARNFLKGRATIQGDGSLHAGKMIKFDGHAQGFNPEGFINSSRHRIYVRGGFTSELVFCSNTKPQ